MKHLVIIGLDERAHRLLDMVRDREDYVAYVFDYDYETLRQTIQDYRVRNTRFDTLPEVARKGDIIVINLPFAKYEQVFREINPYIKEDAVVTNLNSHKGLIEQNRRKILLNRQDNFIQSNILYNFGDNASKKILILMDRQMTLSSLKKVGDFWKDLGFDTETVTAEENDLLMANVLHLPFVIEKLSFPVVYGLELFKTLKNSQDFIYEDIFHNRAQLLNSCMMLMDWLPKYADVDYLYMAPFKNKSMLLDMHRRSMGGDVSELEVIMRRDKQILHDIEVGNFARLAIENIYLDKFITNFNYSYVNLDAMNLLCSVNENFPFRRAYLRDAGLIGEQMDILKSRLLGFINLLQDRGVSESRIKSFLND